MNKILVLYKSKYGATKKYAEMLKEALPCDVINIDVFTKEEFDDYDSIILAGGIYASGIAGLKFLKKNYSNLKHKNIIIFCVGASPFDQDAFDQIKTHNLKNELQNIPVFYGRGGWNLSKMTFKDRTLCKMLIKMVSKKDPDTCQPWQLALLSAGDQICDWTDIKYLTPLIDYVKNI